MKKINKTKKWEIILSLVLFGIGFYIFKTDGTDVLIDNILRATFFTLFAVLILKQWLKKARK